MLLFVGSSRLCSRSSTIHHSYYPLSTLISPSLNRHNYADDIELFFSFHPRNFDSSITHLQTDFLPDVANLPRLDSSEREFLIIQLKNFDTFSHFDTIPKSVC